MSLFQHKKALIVILSLLLLGVVGYAAWSSGILGRLIYQPVSPESFSSLQEPPPRNDLPIPELNPDPQDNLDKGPVDAEGNRLYRNNGFGFELKYPAEFKSDRWLLVPDLAKPGALDKVGTYFSGTMENGSKAVISVVATNYDKDSFWLCATCDPAPEEIIPGIVGGESGEFIPRAHFAQVKRKNIYYEIRIYDGGGAGQSVLDSLFEDVIKSFRFY